MDITVTGRHTQISDRFRERLDEKLAKVSQLDPRVGRIDVVVSREQVKRSGGDVDRVEVTCHTPGPVIRAEASMDDRYTALDAVVDKLYERMRRANDKRRVHRGRRTPESVAQATARIEEPILASPAPDSEGEDRDLFGAVGDSPIEVREKIHTSAPMTLDQALREMELVGHDFYLYCDADTGKPSVVYRRRGWSYGVLHLEIADAEAEAS
ncbi:ribosome hibernation-promoting factor, HPF/YfiA family [Actinomycetota bacterium]